MCHSRCASHIDRHRLPLLLPTLQRYYSFPLLPAQQSSDTHRFVQYCNYKSPNCLRTKHNTNHFPDIEHRIITTYMSCPVGTRMSIHATNFEPFCKNSIISG